VRELPFPGAELNPTSPLSRLYYVRNPDQIAVYIEGLHKGGSLSWFARV